MPTPSVLQTIVGAVVADAVGLAVAFGASLNTVQQAAILAFVGSTSTGVVAVVGYLHGQHAKKQAAPPPVVAPAPPAAVPPPAPPAA